MTSKEEMEDQDESGLQQYPQLHQPEPLDEPPQVRKTGGWADETFGREKGKRKRDQVEEDERLKVQDDSDDDIPIIPDIEELQEEELTTQLAAPPSVSVTRVATYKQLDSDLHKHAGLFMLDGEIDLKLLAKVLSPEPEVTEEDKRWEWNRLFAEMSPHIQEVWDRATGTNLSHGKDGLSSILSGILSEKSTISS